jgi:hypothetical protein
MGVAQAATASAAPRARGLAPGLVPLMHYASHGEKGARERQDPATRGAKNQR